MEKAFIYGMSVGGNNYIAETSYLRYVFLVQ